MHLGIIPRYCLSDCNGAMKGAVVISTILLLFAGCGKAQPSNKADEMADIMQDIMGMNELMSGKTDGDDPDKPAVVLTHVPTERKETNVQNSRKSPQMPHTESKTMHIYTSSAKRKTDTAPPTPPAPQSKTATVTTATPPTPPTPGVVTMTSSPDHENKYLKHIQKLLLAIL